MRNPNRTTKRERRAVRRYNPYAARVLGAAEAARWYRRGILLDEAAGFDNILNDLKHGPVPLDLNDRVNATIDGKRDRLERILGTVPGALTPTSSNVNHYSGGPMQVIEVAPRYTEATGYDVEPDGYINLRYPAHISMVMDVHQLEPGEWQATVDATRRAPASLTLPESLGGGTIKVEHDVAEADGPATRPPADLDALTNAIIDRQRDAAEPLGPSECGHYEVVEVAMNADALAMPKSWLAKYEEYRKAGEDGDKMVWHEDEPMIEFPLGEPFAPIGPSLLPTPPAEGAIYDVDADGSATLHDCDIAPCGWTQPRAGADPRDWHEPDEAAALRAEAIERELDDDINPEE